MPERIVALEMLLSSIKTAGAKRSDAVLEASLPLPAKERSVLAVAIHQGCGALVTGIARISGRCMAARFMA